MAIKSSGELSLNNDIRPEIDIDANQTDVSLGDNNTQAFTAVSDGSTTTGRSMSEMYGYSAVPAYYPETEAEGALGESLNFNGSNQYLDIDTDFTHTQTIATYSIWLKRQKGDDDQGTIIATGDGQTDRVWIRFNTNSSNLDGKLQVVASVSGSTKIQLVYNVPFIDTTSWYHFVIAFDTTKSIQNDRVRAYVNGIEIKEIDSSIKSEIWPSQNQELDLHNNIRINDIYWSSGYGGEHTYADFKYIDGQQLRPDSFGKLDNGIWIPKAFNTPSTDTLVTSNLTANYDFVGGSMEDLSGNNNTATNRGSMSHYATNYGIVYNNNSTSKSINIPDIINSHSCTINCWANMTEGPVWTMFKEIYCYLTYNGNGTLDFYWSNAGSVVQNYPITDNKWYMFTVTSTSTKVKFYIDGKLIATGTSSGTFQQNYNYYDNSLLYSHHTSTPSAATGFIGEFQSYSTQLTDAQILQNYNATKHKYAYGLNGFHLPLNNTSTGTIVSDSSLKVHLDASDTNSYTGSGSSWLDLSGNSATATLNGVNFLSTTNGGVFDFDGSNDDATIDDTKINYSNFSLEFWFNPDGSLSSSNTIFSRYSTTSSQNVWHIRGNDTNNGIEFVRYSGGSGAVLKDSTVVPVNKWTHVLVTHDETNGKLKIYKNGNLDAEHSISSTIPTGSTVDLLIGNLQGYSFRYDGQMAQIRFYNDILTAQEVITNYRATQGNYEQVSTVDISGNANSFNSIQLTYTDHTKTEPANTYVSLNPAGKPSSGTYEYQYGNTRTFSSTHNVDFGTTGTISVDSGKWYFECKFIANANYSGTTGWMDSANPTFVHSDIYPIGTIGTAGTSHIRVNTTTGTNTFVTVKSNFSTNGTWTEKVSVAFDADTGKLWVKAASDTAWYNSGDPAAGTNPVTTVVSESGNTVQSFIMFAAQGGNTRGVWWYPEESDWEGTVPTGFKAVSTANLATPVIDPADDPGEKPQDYFKTVLYEGIGDQQGRDYGYKSGSRAAIIDNSSNKYITFPNIPNALTNTSNDDFSISIWFNLDSIPSSSSTYYNLFGKGNPTTSANYQMLYGLLRGTSNTNEVQFEFRRGYNGATYDATTYNVQKVLSANTWYHLALSYTASNKNLIIYINGANEGTDVLSSASTGRTIEAGFNIGSYRTGTNGFPGKVDDFRIYSDVLTAAEVGYIYNDTTASIPTDNLKAHYKFEGNAKDTSLTNGKIDGAAVFNGSSSLITTPVNSDNVESISMWFYFVSGDTFHRTIGCNISSGNPQTYFEVGTNGSVGFAVKNTARGAGAGTLGSTGWKHAYIDSSGNFYLNGSSVSTSSVSFTGTTNVDLIIGSLKSNYGFFNSEIDQVRFFNKTLSSSEVSTLAAENSSSSANKAVTDIFSDGSAIALYQLDGNSRDTGGNYHGTDSNVSYGFDGTETSITYTYDEPIDNIKVGWKPDLVWIKDRGVSGSNNVLSDSVRGVGKFVISNLSSSEYTSAGGTLSRFDEDGFTLATASPAYDFNIDGNSYAAWVWKAGGDAVSDTSGNVTSQVSANTTSGFSIVKYNDGGTSQQTVAHGLNAAPSLIITKELSNNNDWIVYTTAVDGSMDFLRLNTATTVSGSSLTVPTTDFIYSRGSTSDIINYCFHSVSGFSKIGTYEGNTNDNGPFINLGFEPAWVMVKNIDDTASWLIFDNKRDTSNNLSKYLFANENYDEDTNAERVLQVFSNGFKPVGTSGTINTNHTILYMAFAGDPQKHSNATGIFGDGNEFIQDGYYPQDNFNATTYTGTGSDQIINTNMEPDLVWIKQRNTTQNHRWFDSVRGETKIIASSNTDAEGTNTETLTSFDSNGFTLGNNVAVNTSSGTYVAWSWKAAGQPKKSALFNGSSSYIDLGNNSSINASLISVSCWFKTTSTSQGIIWNNGGQDSQSTGLCLSVQGSGVLYFQGNTGTTFVNDTGTTTVNDGNWHHVVANYDNGDFNVYLDGNSTPELTGTSSAFTTTANQNFLIGRLSRVASSPFDGQIDQFRIFNRELTTSEITTVYNETVSDNDTLQILGGGDTSCIAAYKLDGNALDLSGSYNGTESNITYQKNSHYTYNIYENGARSTSHKASTLSLDAGTIIPDAVNANRDNGFSIVKWTGNGISGSNIAHGLGNAPQIILTKCLSNATSWIFGIGGISGFGVNDYLTLNTTSAKASLTNFYQAYSSNTFQVGVSSANEMNKNSSNEYISYCIRSVPGFSKVGTYTGTGGANTIYTGFAPKFLLIKRTDSSGNWRLFDRARDNTGLPQRIDFALYHSNIAEYNASSETYGYAYFGTEGFYFVTGQSNVDINANNGTYIYIAFAHK